MHEATFIRDLALVIVTAAATAVIFRLLRLPVLLGYLLAGMLIGPHLLEHSLVANQDAIRQLSELGVIFLMFYIGMEFELERLRQLLGSALLAVGLQSAAMLMIGLMSAPLLGWGRTEGFFLGGLLAISSSMVTMQVFRERQVQNHPHAQLAMGILVLEDILAIALLVVLTGVGVKGQFAWADLWQVAFLIGVFVVAVYVIGRILAPPLLNLLHRIGSPEMITLVTMALVLGVGELAAQSHFSVALGAFMAGAILCRSSLAEDIEQLTAPLRMLFSAVFFVAVGMWMDPAVLLDQWKAILLLSLLVIVGKTLTCFVGLAAMGNAPRSALRAALGKAQIGEFSFVIAALGEALGVTGSELTAVAGGVALVTILATYPLSASSLNIYRFFRKHAPEVLVHFGRSYQSMFKATGEAMGRIALLKLIRRPLFASAGNFFLFNAIVLLAALLSANLAESPHLTLYQSLVWSVTALLTAPTVVATVRHTDVALRIITEASLENEPYSSERLQPFFYLLSWSIALILFGAIFFGAAADALPSGLAMGIFIFLVLGVGIAFRARLGRLNSHIECLFLESFQQEARSMAARKREEARRHIEAHYPWRIKLEEIFIGAHTQSAGRTIRELDLREHTGATIMAISRGDYTHLDPHPDTPVFPGDRLVILGNADQTIAARQLLTRLSQTLDGQTATGAFEVDHLYLEDNCPLEGDTLAGANLRGRFGVNVIGIQRGERRITSPGPNEMMLSGDLLWVAGKRDKIAQLRQHTRRPDPAA